MESIMKNDLKVGNWLRSKREAVNMTQSDVAAALGYESHKMISQIESGHRRIPPAKYADYAKMLRVDRVDFMKEVLRHYDPHAYDMLFDK
jgi:transcriptional regulator with XRE-family HTH domain